jgi:hypothetical protein
VHAHFLGLEYRYTAVVGVNDRALPNSAAATPQKLDRLQHEAALAAEAACCSPPCTRARDSLYVSWTGQPCPFLVGPRAGRSRHSLLDP